MVTQEVRRDILGPILKEIQEDSMAGSSNPLTARLGIAGKLADMVGRAAVATDEFMKDAYRVEDEVFRMATYMRRRQLGDTPETAAATARDQFLDYDIRAPWINRARQTVLPFIAYTYRAVPLIARAVAARPWKLGKYFIVAYMVDQLAYLATGDDDDREDEERRSMREEERGYTWIGVPRMMRMPYRDANGNPVFLDIRRWIPAGDIFDTNQGHSVIPVPAPLQFGGPVLMAFELALNKNAFTGKEIRNELTDDWWDVGTKTADYAWKSWMPSAAWVPGSWYWQKIANAATGARDAMGQPYRLPEAVASSVGIKLKPQDLETNFEYRRREFDREENALKAEIRQVSKDRARGLISERQFNARVDHIMGKMNRLVDRQEETFRSPKERSPRETSPR
jgi:hypothetical protein